MFFISIILIFLVIKVFLMVLWGSIARKMGKKYGIYLFFGLLSIYLPPLLLAFNKFMITHRIVLISVLLLIFSTIIYSTLPEPPELRTYNPKDLPFPHIDFEELDRIDKERH